MNFTAEASQKINPVLTTNIFGKLTVWWVLQDILWFRKTHDIKNSDVYNVLPDHRSCILSKKLETAWERELEEAEKKKTAPSLWKALIRTFTNPILTVLPLPICFGTISVVQPLIAKRLISYFQAGSSTSVIQASSFGTLMVVLMIVYVFLQRHTQYLVFQLGMKIRIACNSLVFKKITRLSISSMNSCSEGSIINLMTADVSKFEYFLISFVNVLIIPLQFVIATSVMWQDLGIIVFVVFAILYIQCLPLSILYHFIFTKIRVKLTDRQDERISLINEMLNGICTIKMYVWEKAFEKMAFLSRSGEMNFLVKLSLMNGIIMIMSACVFRSSIFLTLVVYTLISSDALTFDKIVSIIILLNALMIPASIHSMLCSQLAADIKISLKRIQEFLCMKEVCNYVKSSDCQTGEVCISIKNVSTVWNNDVSALQNLSAEINSNKLCCITGTVGSGKSSLLKLILDEFPPISGQIQVFGKISYASQEPWLFPASIRDNILLDEEYNEEKYKKVIEVCELAADFNVLPYGDKTFVGERGMALSGGQCSRVNLARTIYKDADIYLFDDPLAALDVHVSKKIFEKCINGYLRYRTRILVTHDIEHLQKSDEVILMKKGTIEFQGSPDKFNRSFENLSCYSNAQEGRCPNLNDENFTRNQSTIRTEITEKNKNIYSQETEELAAEGYISKSVLREYIRATDSFFLIFVLIANLIATYAIFTFFDFALIDGANEPAIDLKDFNNYTIEAKNVYHSVDYKYIFGEKSLYFCGCLLLMAFASMSLNQYLYYFLFLRANKNVYNKMIASVIRAPMQFFQSNTIGRILNRFSKDTMIADELLLRGVMISISLLTFLLLMFVVVGKSNWWTIFPLLIAVITLIWLTKIFMLNILTLARFEGISKSRVLSVTASSIRGFLTIRTCRAESVFGKMFHMYKDRHTSVDFLNLSIVMAHGLYCQLSLAVSLAVIVFSSIIFKEHIYASSIGYVLANMTYFLDLLQFALRLFIESVINSISVERMIQYTKLDDETAIVENNINIETPKFWPEMGELKFIQVFLRYSKDSEPVLKDLTFTVEPGSKIGIVGRTGAGKSSIITALFRLAEFDGSILIDGINTKSVNLYDLRSKISIIPQVPFLFSTSLRRNVDPLNEFSDALIWSALRDVKLDQTFTTLDHPIEKAGSNLSVGQRQLICIARAIIHKNKILILDEATANVDSATDALIQNIIRTNFTNCTVLIIAHRLNTILNSDKILVIDEGKIVEFNRPDVLLQKKDGFFARMVQVSDKAATVTKL